MTQYDDASTGGMRIVVSLPPIQVSAHGLITSCTDGGGYEGNGAIDNGVHERQRYGL